jgi:hypothetical protein
MTTPTVVAPSAQPITAYALPLSSNQRLVAQVKCLSPEPKACRTAQIVSVTTQQAARSSQHVSRNTRQGKLHHETRLTSDVASFRHLMTPLNTGASSFKLRKTTFTSYAAKPKVDPTEPSWSCVVPPAASDKLPIRPTSSSELRPSDDTNSQTRNSQRVCFASIRQISSNLGS